MNIIFEVSRGLWSSICWNCTKWIQIDFAVNLARWLDSRLKRRKAKATTNNMVLSLKIRPRRSSGVFILMFITIIIGVRVWFCGIKRENHSSWGNHCAEPRHEMDPYYRRNGTALGVVIARVLHRALKLCYSQCSLQAAGLLKACLLHIFGTSRTFVASFTFLLQTNHLQVKQHTGLMGEASSRRSSVPPTILPGIRNACRTLRVLQAPEKLWILHKVTFMSSTYI